MMRARNTKPVKLIEWAIVVLLSKVLTRAELAAPKKYTIHIGDLGRVPVILPS
ncbi:MAG: hypothetical protein ACYS74_01405 [Planctomycetota bacterium]|jgi:hypothetical protein